MRKRSVILSIVGASVQNTSIEEFNKVAQLTLIEHNPSVRAIEYIPYVPNTLRHDIESIASDYYNASIPIIDVNGNVRDTQPYYYPVYYIYPIETNQDALGLDLTSEPERNNTINNAITHRSYYISAPIKAVQDSPGQRSIIMVGPIEDSKDLMLGVYSMTALVINELQYYKTSDIHVQLITNNEIFVDIKTSNEEWIDLGWKPISKIPSSGVLVSVFQTNWTVVVTKGDNFDTDNTNGLVTVIVSVVVSFIMVLVLLISARLYYVYTKNKVAKTQEKINTQKWEFMNFICHEIRVPFQTIVVGLSNISETDLDDYVRDAFYRVSSAVNTASHILNEFLQFSKLEQNKLSVDKTYFNLYDLMESVSNIFEPLAKKKGLIFNIYYPEKIQVYADRFRLQEVINNMVSNGIKYTAEGNVEVIVSVDDSFLSVDVADTGYGISEENLNRLFKPYERITRKGSSQIGTGLGLVISKHIIVDLHEGDIGANSIEGKGSTFWFKIPTKIRKSPKKSDETVQNIIKSSSTKRILVVDDNDDNRFVFEHMLKSRKHIVSLAKNGKHALEVIKSKDGEFDLVFMDKHMPLMDGIEATAAIKKEWKHIYVWGITGNPEQIDSEWISAGVDAIYGKPVDINLIIKGIDSLGTDYAVSSSSSDSESIIEILE